MLVVVLVVRLCVRGMDTWPLVLDLALVAALAHQGYKMLPYTRLVRPQVERGEPGRAQGEPRGIRLLFANVLMTNRESGRLLEIMRAEDPDIFLAVETDAWWQGQLRELASTHPYTVLQPQDNTYGMLLYSRLELIEPEVRFLVQKDIPSIHARARLPSGRLLELHCLHPRPPFPTEDERSTERDAELLIVGKAIKVKETPVIVFGDMNDVAWSRTNKLFQRISGLLDPRVGRGFYNTFHAQLPFVRFPLDHFFHSTHFRVVDFRRLPAFGSDHFPVFISLSLEPDAALEQPEPHPDVEDKQEAEEKIEKAA